MAVQESEFLPPPTQLDILYGFTDLIIVGRVTKVFILRVQMRIGRKYVPTTVRFDVVVSVLLLSAFFARLLALTSAPLALSWKNRNYYNFCHHRKSFATSCPGNVICSGIVEIKMIARATPQVITSTPSKVAGKAQSSGKLWNKLFLRNDEIWHGLISLIGYDKDDLGFAKVLEERCRTRNFSITR